MHAEGTANYGSLPEIKTLEKVHAGMHGLVKRILELDASGKKHSARQEFGKIGPFSERIIAVLTALEDQVAVAK